MFRSHPRRSLRRDLGMLAVGAALTLLLWPAVAALWPLVTR